ncbi:hypothetical protein, unknown function [Leishmania mexicana MHOM/GT/2001/U1103]|uniref:Uncharacterized protein n=1 Tax=Leishmania mexicana (strain MHOM/GT/2001/U1103) TaxID=929439 RepID=E9B524_LEIMU|nr:hypothetical protein, unknown function [Leishmania mexicana MHOM/GT/2001/U1103]CBZ30343.1 hypothetical protein, unknown function [Leishmania mexicana MHOM/GT/2001/U1103]
MNILHKIFTPGSKSKKTLLHCDVEAGDRQSNSSPKVSTSVQIKRKSTGKSSDDDDCGPLMRSVSMTVVSDPVPTSFKTNSSFANQSRPTQGPASFRSVPPASSLSNASCHLERHHQHTAALASSVSRHNQRSLFDKIQGSGSFAVGETTVSGGSFTANGGTVNLWRLPWTQKKVTMCPNCHRPRERDRNVYVSRASYVLQETTIENGMGDDMSEANEDMSYSESEGMGGPMSDSVTCRCGVVSEGDAPLDYDDSAEATEEHPQMFIVETQNPSAVQLPGTVAEASDSEDEGRDDLRRSYKLSFVSPPTSTSLRRRAPHAQRPLGGASPQSNTASVPKRVTHWLHEQQTSEAPVLSKPKATI